LREETRRWDAAEDDKKDDRKEQSGQQGDVFLGERNHHPGDAIYVLI